MSCRQHKSKTCTKVSQGPNNRPGSSRFGWRFPAATLLCDVAAVGRVHVAGAKVGASHATAATSSREQIDDRRAPAFPVVGLRTAQRYSRRAPKPSSQRSSLRFSPRPFCRRHARRPLRWQIFHIKLASHSPPSASFPASHSRLFCQTSPVTPTTTALPHQRRTWTRPKGFCCTIVCVLLFVHRLDWPIFGYPGQSTRMTNRNRQERLYARYHFLHCSCLHVYCLRAVLRGAVVCL